MKQLKLFFALFAMLALGVGNAWAETVTLNNLGAGLSSTSNSSVSTTKVGDYTLNYLQGKKQGSSILLAKGTNGGTSFISNKTPIPGAIKSVTVYINSGAAGKTTYHCAFSTTECTSKYTTGSTAVNITGGNNHKYTCSVASASYFCISLGNNNNGQVLKLEIEYTPDSSGGSGETVVSVPTFSVPECTFYSSSLDVELSCATDGATIHYTIDGSTPSETSPTYSGAIAINNTTTIKAIAVKDGLTNSEVATATYTKGETVTSYDIDFEKNALEAYVNWDFSNITIAKTITAKGGTYYGNTSGKASASIKTKEQIQYPGTLTFSVSKESTNTTASNWLVQVSENGTTWSTVGTISATEMTKGDWKNHSVDLSDYENVYVQISYGSSTAIRAIDEISLAQGVAPVKYTLTIENPENGTLSVTKGGVSVVSGEQFKAGTSLVVTPTPASGYLFESLTVDGTEVELSEGKYTFTMPENNVTISATFKANEKPAATLTLSKNGETELLPGDYKQDDVVTLPDFESDCSKTFVGWSENPNCNTEPEYKAGDSYQLKLEGNQTLYAVYADGEGGGDFTITKTMSEIVSTNGYTVSSGNTAICYTSLTLDENITLSTTGQANCGSFWSDPREWRLYQNKSGNAIVTATNGCTLTSVKFTFTVSNTGVLLNNGSQVESNTAVAASGASVTYTVGNSGSATNGQVRITAIEVSYSKEGEYSNFSTSCVEALNAPTFSPAGGTFTTEQNITLYAEEGDIYYTLDGSNPTKESNKYENIPVLLDECGTTTIKAIAISAESKSSIASATYTINLPITNTTATAYTPAEAIAIIDGECDKTEEVFVKGVVVSTSAFSAEYGNYDVIVKAVDDNSATPTTFTFYHMYKAASQTKFMASDEVIGVGDIITAKGKLTKYYSTYELADGCYMVERVAYTEPKTDISNTLETAYTVDKAFELISDIKSDLDKEVYVKGLVAVASTELYEEKYLTYSISDNGQNSGNVLKVYDGLNIDGVAFTSKDDVKVGDYVVVKGKLLNYKGTYEINKDNQLVQHKKAATITVSDITMEVGETKTIAATITPAAAETAVTYTIKENAANAISLSNNVITANAVGTATITATIATAADYMGKTVDFTVTVNAKSTKEKVVILAKYGDQWYAMMAQYVSGKTSHLAALPVTYVGGKLYNVADADKSLIEWERAIVDGKATFKNGSNYLTGKSGKTDLTLATTAYEWTIDGDSYLTGDRTFLYNAENNWFRHFGISNAGNKNYSGMPVVTAPVYATGQAYGRTSAAGKFGTICLPFGSTNYTGATFYEFVGSETGKVYLGSVTTLEAGVPYIFEASATEVAVYGNGGATASTAGNSNGLHGTFANDTEVAVGNYILLNNKLCQAAEICYVNANRAYIVMEDVPTGVPTQMPGRRYIGMSVQGENETTGVEDLFTTDAPVKVIENGQLIIIRDGVKYNVQGQVIR